HAAHVQEGRLALGVLGPAGLLDLAADHHVLADEAHGLLGGDGFLGEGGGRRGQGGHQGQGLGQTIHGGILQWRERKGGPPRDRPAAAVGKGSQVAVSRAWASPRSALSSRVSMSSRMSMRSSRVPMPLMKRVSTAAPNSGVGRICSAASGTTSDTPSTTMPTTRSSTLRTIITVKLS